MTAHDFDMGNPEKIVLWMMDFFISLKADKNTS